MAAPKLVAEGLGTAFLLAIVVGSGIMGERLAGGNDAIALLANSIATGTGLVVLIMTFGPISGAHFNPVVTLVALLRKELSLRLALGYVVTQIVGAYAGVASAHLMFDLPAYTLSTHARHGIGQWWSEFIATFGLLLVILSCVRHRPTAVPFAVAAYITRSEEHTSELQSPTTIASKKAVPRPSAASLRTAIKIPYCRSGRVFASARVYLGTLGASW